MTQKELLAYLELASPRLCNGIFAKVVEHRSACLHLVEATILEMLADPKITRSRLRRELANVIRHVEEHGP